MPRRIPLALVAVALTAVSACSDETPEEEASPASPEFAAFVNATDAQLSSMMEQMNAAFAGGDVEYRVAMAEYVTQDAMGGTVIAKDVGNKQLSFDFVANDPRRGWSGPLGGETDDITYAIDETADAVPPFGGVSGADASAAIVRAMDTWDALQCSDIALNRAPDFGFDIGVVAFSAGLGGSPFVFADVQHAGWRDIDFAGTILGVTFTFGFVDANGFTDVNNDGRIDAAFREIYYDPSYSWADDGSANVDIETVALHEAGHGLGQAHFGTVRIKNDGTLQASPRAVMNALYSGPLRDLAGTDNGGHCANWGSWPHAKSFPE